MPARRPEIPAVWTIRDIIAWGKDYFASKAIDEARLTIELMVCNVLSIRRIELYTDHDRPLTKDELARLKEMVQRRIRHEPLQYILGTTDFFGLAFEVSPSVLIPRPETEILVDHALRHIRLQNGSLRCLDIGTGSGIIPVTIAVNAESTQWTAMDVSSAALVCAHRNAHRHGVADRIVFVEGDVLEIIPAGGPWDLVTMNPPYIADADVAELDPEVRNHEPRMALTDNDDGLSFYRRLATVFDEIVSGGGLAILEIGYGQATAVRALFESAGLTITVIRDLADIERVVSVRR
jgi:release factor glutamine methyltransferase